MYFLNTIFDLHVAGLWKSSTRCILGNILITWPHWGGSHSRGCLAWSCTPGWTSPGSRGAARTGTPALQGGRRERTGLHMIQIKHQIQRNFLCTVLVEIETSLQICSRAVDPDLSTKNWKIANNCNFIKFFQSKFAQAPLFLSCEHSFMFFTS